MTSPSFDFRFARAAPDLGPEAQRMMDELRDEALRIKAKLAAERETEKTRTNQGDQLMHSSRKIAKPKGKAGRFSDVHMEQFKKMDSIAGHASAFRAQPGKFAPLATGSLKRTQSKAQLREDNAHGSATGKSLKRTQSKARLDEPDVFDKPSSAHTDLSASPGKRRMGANDLTKPGPDVTGTTSNDQSQSRRREIMPLKRARTEHVEASATPRKQDVAAVVAKPATPSTSRPQSILQSLTTPTQASLARAATIQQASQLPTTSQTKPKPNMATPSRFTKTSAVSNIGSIARSLMRRIDKSPDKQNAAIVDELTSRPMKTPSKVNLNKKLPSVPTTPLLTVPKLLEQVNVSPSPFKSGIPRSKSTAITGTTVKYPDLSSGSRPTTSDSVSYPPLSRARPNAALPDSVLPLSPPSVPGTFTFTANHTIKFGSPSAFGSSPGQSRLRQVRPSFAPQTMPGAFPHDNKENDSGLPMTRLAFFDEKKLNVGEGSEDISSFAHGLSNKKRHRAEESGDEDDGDRSPKKRKANTAGDSTNKDQTRLQQKLMAERTAPHSRIPSPVKKRRMMSMSRLNMLAKPKDRR